MPVPKVAGVKVNRGNTTPARPSMPKKIGQVRPKVGTTKAGGSRR